MQSMSLHLFPCNTPVASIFTYLFLSSSTVLNMSKRLYGHHSEQRCRINTLSKVSFVCKIN